ncbi:MAG: hypothetical protein AAGF12_41880, partial [Myxococcota bacterium]
GPLRFLVGMQYVPEQRTDGPRAEFGFGLTSARAGLCALTRGRLSVGGCAALSLGALYAVVYQPSPTDPGARFYSALEASAMASLQLVGPLVVALEAGVTIPFDRYRFRVEGRDSIEFQQSVVIPKAVFSLGVHFP